MKADADAAPQVSIIVPVYNVEAYLRRCLNSILAQTICEWECICVDDGSPDACGAILDEYAAKDSRFVVIHQENRGVSVARNAGIEAARGEYIGFVDPDDWIEANTYEVALKAARESGADIVQWGWTIEHSDESAPQKKRLKKEKREGFFDVKQNPKNYSGTPWNHLVKSSLVRENNIRFPAGVRVSQDTDFFIVAYALAKSSFYLNRPLYHYDRANEGSTWRNVTAKLLLECVESRKKSIKKAEEIYSDGGG